MSSEEKKALLLLKSVIFHYHGLDEDELQLLQDSAQQLNALEELDWANQFISEDYMSAFDRSREFLNKIFLGFDKNQRLAYLIDVWQDNNKKGYITEMEASAMLHLAKDWNVEKELIEKIRN